jgi:hypothetical protein
VRALDSFPALTGRVPPDGLVREVLVTGPFAQWSRSSAADGVLLVGDAADFFDPFTGQGLFAALRGAEIAGAELDAALRRPGPVAGRALARYRRARRAAFAGRWALERLIALRVAWPALAERVIGRLARRPASRRPWWARAATWSPRGARARAGVARRNVAVSRDGVPPQLFRDLLGRFATGVTALTARAADGRPFGMTANALASVSLDPPLVLVCVDRTRDIHDVLRAAPPSR